MTRLFEELKQRNSSQTVQDEAGKRLRNITEEVEKMKIAMEDKDRQIRGRPLLIGQRSCWGGGGRSAGLNTGEFCLPRIRGQDPSAHQAQRGESRRSVQDGGRGGVPSEIYRQTC